MPNQLLFRECLLSDPHCTKHCEAYRGCSEGYYSSCLKELNTHEDNLQSSMFVRILYFPKARRYVLGRKRERREGCKLKQPKAGVKRWGRGGAWTGLDQGEAGSEVASVSQAWGQGSIGTGWSQRRCGRGRMVRRW